MKVNQVEYRNTGYFSKLICDYIDKSDALRSFYTNFPSIEGFRNQISQKSSFPHENRKVLVDVLKEQYTNVQVHEKTQVNIDTLLDENTFTVTTGHQLNIFTGPLYFLYKIISAIKLCEILKLEYPNQQFVPVYWMATEDHDFEEINFFNMKNGKVAWKREAAGAVGRLQTTDFDLVLEKFDELLEESLNANLLKELFKRAYLENNTLSEAMRFLVNELFGSYGLVIIDGDSKQLKFLFAEHIKDELLNKSAFREVSQTNERLGTDYKIQVNPREINLFYLTDELRERIIQDEHGYKINNTSLIYSEKEILEILEKHPERFSPNVIMRPLFQETILPNLCYIGGGGELGYWFQLKSYFDSRNIPFPILLLRNSGLFVREKQVKKMTNLELNFEDLFQEQTELVNGRVKAISDIKIDFTDQRHYLQAQFTALKDLAKRTDSSFLGAVNAQEKKQLNGLDKLEKRLLKAQKRKLSDQINRICKLQDALFPNGSLEERTLNFAVYYLELGDTLIPDLYNALDPLDLRFTILEY